jgi:hypothetical protein
MFAANTETTLGWVRFLNERSNGGRERGRAMIPIARKFFALVGLLALIAGWASAADSIRGQVLGGGAPIAKSTVTLWEASADAPKQVAQTKTSDDGQFEVRTNGSQGDAILYLVATGGEPAAHKGSGDNAAIVLMTALGSQPPPVVTINEFTTVASVWTNAQFLNATRLQGHALGLRIAAGNVPSAAV